MTYKNPEKVKEYQKQYRESHRQYFRNAYKKWYDENTHKHIEHRQKYREDPLNRKKDAARSAVYYAIKTGKLVRPAYCEGCSSPCKPEADHHDYDRKLDVKWLCKPCHVAVTIQRKDGTIKS